MAAAPRYRPGMGTDSGSSSPIHYVITVHGMGEAREYETSHDMANLFGTGAHLGQRGVDGLCEPRRRISLATSEPYRKRWVAFEGIPQPGYEPSPFTGMQAADDDSSQLRFVDCAWSGITREAFRDHGEAPERWATSVLERLEHRKPSAPEWVLRLLGLLRRAILVLRKLLIGKASQVSKVAFDDYLGDVQMYGDVYEVRAEAVGNFHQVMDAVHQEHEFEFGPDGPPPRYTIVAHSLGTVMALDALVDAHRVGQATAPWVGCVQSFVSLGSPIDKFLMIWWYRFRYLNRPDEYRRGDAHSDQVFDKIRHFNYCDEQDPVGHNLDVVSQTATYQKLFHTVEDRVYNRYAVPGLAHLGYFKDSELFAHIHDCAVSGQEPVENQGARDSRILWFSPKVYTRLLLFTYLLVPMLVAVASTFLMILAVTAGSLWSRVVATLAFGGVWLLGRILVDLMTWWRQVQRLKWLPGDATADRVRASRAARFRASLVVCVVALHVLLALAAWGLNGTTIWRNTGTAYWLSLLLPLPLSVLVWQRFLAPRRLPAAANVVPRWSSIDTLSVLSVAGAIAIGCLLAATGLNTGFARWLTSGLDRDVLFSGAVFLANLGAIGLYVRLAMNRSKDVLRMRDEVTRSRPRPSGAGAGGTAARGTAASGAGFCFEDYVGRQSG